MASKSFMAGLFGRPPFRPLQDHMQVVADCAAEVVPLFETYSAGDMSAVVQHKDKIFELEQEADDIKNDIRQHLPKSLFMPVARRDILDMLHAQDSIADAAQDVAGLLFLRQEEIPEPFRPLIMPYVESNLATVKAAQRVVSELDELVETGFSERAISRVEEMMGDISRHENDSDVKGMELTRLLFQLDEKLSIASFFVWNQIFERLGDIADSAEDAGDRLRLLIAR